MVRGGLFERLWAAGLSEGRPLARLGGPGVVVTVAAVTLGCASPAPMQAWLMPAMPLGSDGVPFATDPETVARADVGEDAERVGDLPEMAQVTTRGFWRSDEEAALREARARGLGVFVHFYAEWSEASRKLDRDLLQDWEVRQAIAARYVPLRIDLTEETMAGRDQCSRYRVERLPTMVLLGPDGLEQTRLTSSLEAGDLLVQLERVARVDP
ncbi:MAG: thioredoxin family protein [Myxococcales bacterium]|nr:thioredoxin family protein [Myxococcales bacterium]